MIYSRRTIISMLFEMTMILLGISVVGFGLAGWWDLKTTEFPDWLPYGIIGGALATRAGFAFLMGDYSLIINSVIVGLLFLGFGLLLYWTKQWGDGDAWLLGAMGFLWPDSGSFLITGFLPFPAIMLFNFFFIAFFYLLVYSIALGIRSPEISKGFLKEIKGAKRDLLRVTGLFTMAIVGLMVAMFLMFSIPLVELLYLLIFPLLLVSVLLFTRYGRFVEGNLFKRKVAADKVREGDVLAHDKWRGLTEEEVKRIRKLGKPVWIKEGVRFAPVFLITVLITLLVGNILMFFF